MPRQPTPQERDAERAVTDPIVADFGTNTLLLVVGIAGGSLTLVGEGIRSFLMLAASIYAAMVLRHIHRGRMDHFQFGFAKIERFATMIVGLGLLFSGLWIARGAVNAMFVSGPAPSALWLALAAIANAVNAAVNVAGWARMRADAPHEPSEVYRTQYLARLTMMLSSLFLQVTLTVAALAKDPALALGFDVLGAAFVSVLMVIRGAAMVLSAMPHILDLNFDRELSERVRHAAGAVIPDGEIVRLRTRPCGISQQSEICVAVAHDTRAQMVAKWHHDMQSRLKAGGDDVELAITVDPGPLR